MPYSAYAVGLDVLFEESFDIDTLTTNDTIATYPELTFSHSDPGIVVTDGVLNTPLQTTFITLLDNISGAVELSADVGASGGSSNFPIVANLMGPNVVFHPGYPGGAFRIDGVQPNTDMGFTPAVGVLHHLTVRTDGAGHFDVELVDGNNPSNVFTFSFEDPSTMNQTARLQTGDRAGLFDNIRVIAIPEPSSAALAIAFAGLTSSLAIRRR